MSRGTSLLSSTTLLSSKEPMTITTTTTICPPSVFSSPTSILQLDRLRERGVEPLYPSPLPSSPWVQPPPPQKPEKDFPPFKPINPRPHNPNCICGMDGPQVLMMVIPHGGIRCPAHPEILVRGSEFWCSSHV